MQTNGGICYSLLSEFANACEDIMYALLALKPTEGGSGERKQVSVTCPVHAPSLW